MDAFCKSNIKKPKALDDKQILHSSCLGQSQFFPVTFKNIHTWQHQQPLEREVKIFSTRFKTKVTMAPTRPFTSLKKPHTTCSSDQSFPRDHVHETKAVIHMPGNPRACIKVT